MFKNYKNYIDFNKFCQTLVNVYFLNFKKPELLKFYKEVKYEN